MRPYIGASVLAAAVLNEQWSQRVREWWKGVAREAVVVIELAFLESAAVFSRAVRTGRFSDRDAAAGLQNLDALRGECRVRSQVRGDFALADQIVRDFAT